MSDWKEGDLVETENGQVCFVQTHEAVEGLVIAPIDGIRGISERRLDWEKGKITRVKMPKTPAELVRFIWKHQKQL